ncbi:glycoside hydrolase family 26 protein [Blastococcus saxobsidens]|nr:glycosyl hydrolase [Blastococcus saxobsidens]
MQGSRSGAAWRSGVYVPGSDPEEYEAFAAWRGRELDVVVDWPARSSWADIVNPTWLYNNWSGTPYIKSFGVAMLPEKESASLDACARGSYDRHWREFGENLAERGLADEVIIRLGWEFNGDWYKWSARNPEAFAACWRAIHTQVERVAPELRWDWNVNRGRGHSVADARKAYPGDQYVDIVGIDSYDIWPGVRTEADWQEHLAGEFGLRFWADFAIQRGKQVSVPEWGLYPGTEQAGNNGGDNPLYIEKMVGFFRSLGDHLAYESYFNQSRSGVAGSLVSPNQNPRGSAAYQKLYR